MRNGCNKGISNDDMSIDEDSNGVDICSMFYNDYCSMNYVGMSMRRCMTGEKSERFDI